MAHSMLCGAELEAKGERAMSAKANPKWAEPEQKAKKAHTEGDTRSAMTKRANVSTNMHAPGNGEATALVVVSQNMNWPWAFLLRLTTGAAGRGAAMT